MFLKSIELTNFKCHESLKLSFKQSGNVEDVRQPFVRKNTFILGENGTGKSNLLKAIGLITAGSDALGELLVNPDSWIRNGAKRAQITATIVTADGDDRELQFSINRRDQLKSIIFNNREALDRIDAAISHAERNYFVVGYGASRHLSAERFSRKDGPYFNKRSQNVGNLFSASSTLNPLNSWAMELDYRSSDGLKIVKTALNSFLQTTQFHSIDKEAGKLLFKNQDGIVALDQLSDGYQNMAAWIGDLLYRVTSSFRDYKNPLEARGVLLIDEIDLHLHPKWQRMLHSFISKKLPNFQVITTTHSPLTAQQANEGELFALQRNTKGIDLVPFLGEPQKMLVNQMLMSPVFGLLTDESLEVENAKKAYDEVLLKTNRSATDNKKLVVLGDKIRDLKPSRFINEKHEREMKLLDRIEKQMTSVPGSSMNNTTKKPRKKSASKSTKKKK